MLQLNKTDICTLLAVTVTEADAGFFLGFPFYEKGGGNSFCFNKIINLTFMYPSNFLKSSC